MPRQYLPFSEFKPDGGHFANDGLVTALGILPSGDKFLPLPSMKIRSNTLSSAVGSALRAHVNVNPPSGSPRIYAMIGSTVYVVDTGAGPPWTVTSLTHSGTGNVGCETDAGDIFGYGQHEVFTQGHTNLPKIRLAGAGNLIDLCTTPAAGNAPKPKYGCAIGDRLLIGNIGNTVAAGVGTPDPNPDMLWWSKTRDGRVFATEASNPADRTGYIFLYDDLGGITGLFGSQEYALAFKRRGVWRMDFSGAFGNTFRVMDGLHGCISHRTICPLGPEIYFFSDAGPCVYRNDQVIPLASGKLSAFLANDVPIGSSAPTGHIDSYLGCVADPVNKTVSWLYTYTTDSATNRIRLLVYSAAIDQFSIGFDMAAPATWYTGAGSSSSVTPTLLMGGLPQTAPNLAFHGAVMIAENTTPNPDEMLCVTYTGQDRWWNQDIVIKTGFYQLGGEAGVVVHKVRPVIRTATTLPDIEVSVYTKTRPWDTPVPYGPYELSASGDARGFISVLPNELSQFQQFELTIPRGSEAPAYASKLLEIEGLEVEFSVKGRGL